MSYKITVIGWRADVKKLPLKDYLKTEHLIELTNSSFTEFLRDPKVGIVFKVREEQLEDVSSQLERLGAEFKVEKA